MNVHLRASGPGVGLVLAAASLVALATVAAGTGCTVTSDTSASDAGSTPPVTTDAATSTDAAPEGDAGADAADAADAAPPACSIGTPFASTTEVRVTARSVTLRADELELFAIDDAGALRHAVRATRTAPFPPLDIVDMPAPAQKIAVYLADDGLRLYLTAYVRTPGGEPAPGHPVLFLAQRTNTSAAFTAPVELALRSSFTNVLRTPHLTPDGTGLYFTDAAGGGIKARRIDLPGGTIDDARAAGAALFVDPQPTFTLGGVPTRDGLHLYTSLIDVNVGGGPSDGSGTLALADRTTTTAKFGAPVALTSPAHAPGTSDHPVWLSPDQCRLYFLSGDGGTLEVATRAP